MESASVDFETRSTVELMKSGVYRYAESPNTDLWCMAYAFGDEAPELWLPGLPFPRRLRAHIAGGAELRAFNASFERVIWQAIAVPRHGFPTVRPDQWFCTAAEAAAMALPRSLDMCAKVLGVGQQKSKEGYRLMMQMARPRTVHPDGRIEWWDAPEKQQALGEYCRQDVRTERDVAKVLHRLPTMERQIYLLDQRINDRGLLIDTELVAGAKQIVAVELDRANALVRDVTGGAVGAVTQRNKMLAWLQGQGAEIDTLQKTVVQDMLAGETTDPVRLVLEARAEAGRTSVAKLVSLDACLGADRRVRGLMLYHGATTGRWTARLFQPHNLPRGEVKGVEHYLDMIRRGDHELLSFFEAPIVAVLSMLRNIIVAAPGKVFRSADFSGIEARVTAWLAGQTDLVERFAKGEKVYEAMAAAAYTRLTGARVRVEDIKEGDPRRQLGKALVLGCGFQMGWRKFQATARLAPYFVELTDEEAQGAVETYRAQNPQIVSFWRGINAAAIRAVEDPGSVHYVGPHIRLTRRGAYLWVRLPSGRFLCYPRPRVEVEEMPWGDVAGVTFMTTNAVTRKWEPSRLYGGLLTENVVQATARDIMAAAMLRLEAAGYPLVLSVHDETLVEVPEEHGSQEDYVRIVCQVPSWATGCPIAVGGWSGGRYRK